MNRASIPHHQAAGKRNTATILASSDAHVKREQRPNMATASIGEQAHPLAPNHRGDDANSNATHESTNGGSRSLPGDTKTASPGAPTGGTTFLAAFRTTFSSSLGRGSSRSLLEMPPEAVAPSPLRAKSLHVGDFHGHENRDKNARLVSISVASPTSRTSHDGSSSNSFPNGSQSEVAEERSMSTMTYSMPMEIGGSQDRNEGDTDSSGMPACADKPSPHNVVADSHRALNSTTRTTHVDFPRTLNGDIINAKNTLHSYSHLENCSTILGAADSSTVNRRQGDASLESYTAPDTNSQGIYNAQVAALVRHSAKGSLSVETSAVSIPLPPSADIETPAVVAQGCRATVEMCRLASGEFVDAKNTLQSLSTLAPAFHSNSDLAPRVRIALSPSVGNQMTDQRVDAGTVVENESGTIVVLKDAGDGTALDCHRVKQAQESRSLETLSERASTATLVQPVMASLPMTSSPLPSPMTARTDVFAEALVLGSVAPMPLSLPVQSVAVESDFAGRIQHGQNGSDSNDLESGVQLGFGPKRGKPWQWSKRVVYATICSVVSVMMVMGVLVIGSVCGTSGCFRAGEDEANSSSVPAMSPTLGPSTLEMGQMRAHDVVEYINRVKLFNHTIPAPAFPLSKLFNDSLALQSDEFVEELALSWLVSYDPLQLRPGEPSDEFKLRQRYALATLFLQVDTAYLFGSDDTADECQWPGVKCQTVTLDGDIGLQQVVTQVDLSNRNWIGTIPADLGLLSTLRHFSAFDNAIEGSLPLSLGQLTDLEHFGIYGNRLNGTLPGWIDKWTKLEYLSTGSNSFTGTLPYLGSLSRLRHLSVYENGFTGTLPSWMQQLASLEHLGIYGNQFNGALPKWIGQWTNLLYISAGENSFSGTLPDAIGRWTELQEFYLWKNFLTGTIPSSIGAWMQLKTIDIDSNFLTGTVPVSVANWKHIEIISLDSNSFVGNITAAICDAPNLHRFEVDCCSEVECPCCTGCYGNLPNATPVYVTVPHPNATTRLVRDQLPPGIAHNICT